MKPTQPQAECENKQQKADLMVAAYHKLIKIHLHEHNLMASIIVYICQPKLVEQDPQTDSGLVSICKLILWLIC